MSDVATAQRSFSSLRAASARILSAFIDLLEPVVAGLRGDRRWIAVDLDQTDFAFYRRTGRRTEFLGNGATLTDKQRQTLGAGGGGSVELRLAAKDVITTTLDIPAGGRDYVAQIVEHRLDRLTPWNPEKLLYGYTSKPRPEHNGQIDVHFAATSQDIAAASIRRLEGFGLVPTVLGGAMEPIEKPLGIDLFRGRNDTALQARRKRIGFVAVLLPVLLAIAAAASTYFRFDSAESVAAVEQQIEAARRTLIAGTGNAADRQRDLALIDTKQPANALFVLIDRLAVIIPDTAYLDALEIGRETLRLTGKSTQASTLIEVLEAEPGLETARFAAPVTRDSDGRDRFDITVSRARSDEASQ